jgi:hypothetical protein
MIQNIRKYENLHILLWLVKDVCWISNFKVMGMVMALPTIIVAIFITYIHRNIISELIHNMAVCCWIFANITWMTGEFFFNDGTRPYAIVFISLGVIILSYYYLYLLPFKIKKM